MTKYTASIGPSGRPRKVGPYLLIPERYVDSDGSRHRGWTLWSGDYKIGTGSRGPLFLLPFRHWRHVRQARRWHAEHG